MPPATDSGNIFKKEEYDEHYWDEYLALRPEYSAAFYKRVFDYHAAHSDAWDTAVDIGTGPGQVAAVLAPRFTQVVATDVSTSHLEAAARRLSRGDSLRLLEVGAEGLAGALPAASADMITVAECMPLLDADVALAAFAKVLRPGGTLAIWFYGRPSFAEPAYATACQPHLDAILAASFAKIGMSDRKNAQRQASFVRATVCLNSFLDNVALPEDTWGYVQRHKWNPDRPLCFYGPDAYEFDAPPQSAIRSDEQLSEERDPSFWQREWDISWVRRFLLAIHPDISRDDEDDHIKAEYQHLETAMGGPEAVRKITWPVVLILASKGQAE